MPRQETFLTDRKVAGCFFDQVTTYRSDKQGLQFNDRRFTLPVWVDDFFKPYAQKLISARNAFLLAPTGKGKSVLLNHILRQSVEQGFQVVLVELGASYEKLFYLYPEISAYIRYKEGEPLGLNPFLIRDRQELSADKIRSLTDFICILWKKDKKEEDHERVSLYHILEAYYDQRTTYSFADFYAFVKTGKNLLETLNIDSKFFDRDSFLHVTGPYAEGMFRHLLEDTEGQFYLKDKQIIGFELENCRDNLDILPVMFMAILDAIGNTMGSNRTSGKRIWFEEAAKLLKYPVMLRTIDYYYQTIRKHNGSIGMVLQSVDQIPEDEIGKAIISNTQVFYIMGQDQKLDSLQSRLNLTQHDCSQIRSIRSNFEGGERYTEFLLKMGTRSNVYRLEIPDEALLAYLSESNDKQPIMEAFYQTGSMEKAIVQIMQNQLVLHHQPRE